MIRPDQIENVSDLEDYIDESTDTTIEEHKEELVKWHVNDEDFRGRVDEITHETLDADMIHMNGMTDYGRLYDIIKDYKPTMLDHGLENGDVEETVKQLVFFGIRRELALEIQRKVEDLPDEEKVPEAL